MQEVTVCILKVLVASVLWDKERLPVGVVLTQEGMIVLLDHVL